MAVDLVGEDEAEEQLARFRDYWTARPGRDGVKLKWDATWRNWIRRSKDGNRNTAVAISTGRSELASLLYDESNGQVALAGLAQQPVAALEALREALERKMTPAGREGVVKALTPLLTVYPVGQKSDAEWSAWWTLYIDALADLPAWSLKAAASAYLREDDGFFPKPGRFRALAQTAAGRELRAMVRLRQAEREAARIRTPREVVGRIPPRPEVHSTPQGWVEKSAKPDGFTPPQPTETRQEMADRLRRVAEQHDSSDKT